MLIRFISNLTRYFSPLLHWFSDYVYDRLILPRSNHLLLELNRILDFPLWKLPAPTIPPWNGSRYASSFHPPHLFFDTVLSQIDAAFPDERRRIPIGDTFTEGRFAPEDFTTPLVVKRKVLVSRSSINSLAHHGPVCQKRRPERSWLQSLGVGASPAICRAKQKR